MEKDQINEDSIKSQGISIYKNFVSTLNCHLLNVGGCVKRMSKTFENDYSLDIENLSFYINI